MASERTTTGEIHIPETNFRGSVVVAVIAGAAALAGSFFVGTRTTIPGGDRTFDSFVVAGIVAILAGQAWQARRHKVLARALKDALNHVQQSRVEDTHFLGLKIQELTRGVTALVAIERGLAEKERQQQPKLTGLPGGER